MVGFINLMYDFYSDLMAKLDLYVFQIGYVNVSILDLMLGGIILTFAFGFLWRGVKG